MFIETEATPNPNTLKFLPGRAVMSSGTASYSAETAGHSPLASRLFAVGGVSGIFFGHDFVTVSKEQDADWAALKPQLLAAIMDHYAAGEVPLEAVPPSADEAGEEDPVVDKIRELLDLRIRPMVAGDGGDIIFCGYEDGIVYLEMHGACSGCPSASATLKHGVENMLRYYIPEVQAVEAVN